MLPAVPTSPDPQSDAADKKEADDQLEVAEEDSFPASDPPSITDPAKGIERAEEETKLGRDQISSA